MIGPVTLDALAHAFLATPIGDSLLTTFGQIESPTYGVVVSISKLVLLEFNRAQIFDSLGRLERSLVDFVGTVLSPLGILLRCRFAVAAFAVVCRTSTSMHER